MHEWPNSAMGGPGGTHGGACSTPPSRTVEESFGSHCAVRGQRSALGTWGEGIGARRAPDGTRTGSRGVGARSPRAPLTPRGCRGTLDSRLPPHHHTRRPGGWHRLPVRLWIWLVDWWTHWVPRTPPRRGYVWTWRVLYAMDPRMALRTRIVGQGPKHLSGAYFADGRVELYEYRTDAELIVIALHEWAHADRDNGRHDRAFLRALRHRIGAGGTSVEDIERTGIQLFTSGCWCPHRGGKHPLRSERKRVRHDRLVEARVQRKFRQSKPVLRWQRPVRVVVDEAAP